MSKQFEYISLNLDQKTRVVFTAFSKRNFYLRSSVSQFVLVQGHTPINPFLNVDYNLAGLVPKDSIRISNNTLIAHADEMWVFGEISDGVLMEIYIASKQQKPIRYFQLNLTGDEFREVGPEDVRLEDVSPWMWEWVQTGKSLERWHPRLRFTKTYPLIYPAYSKRNFFLQMHISQFCINQHTVPLNPFMLFRYFLGDTVPRDNVYRSNNNIVNLAKELWVFGEISDGVLAEIKIKRDHGQAVRYYKIESGFPITFRRVPGSAMPFEDPELEQFRHLLV